MDAPLNPSPRMSRLEEMADRFRMLSEPSRLQILDAIGEDEVNVQEICDRTGFKQANVSRHLRLLRDIKAIACRQNGHFHYYRVIDPIVLRCWHCTQDYCQESAQDYCQETTQETELETELKTELETQ